jgi:pimeloyl-ACP methyl ester carboxylesterase
VTGQFHLDLQGPSHDERFKQWWARFERLGASAGCVARAGRNPQFYRCATGLTARPGSDAVIHPTGYRISDVAQGRAVAERIRGARFVELPGDDHIPFLGDYDAITNEIEEFSHRRASAARTDRALATVLFTDIVGSTQRAASLGDRAWRDLLKAHHTSTT